MQLVWRKINLLEKKAATLQRKRGWNLRIRHTGRLLIQIITYLLKKILTRLKIGKLMTNELLTEEDKTAHQKQGLDDHVKILLRNYLDIFYVAIYRVRLLIEISKQIGNQKDRL